MPRSLGESADFRHLLASLAGVAAAEPAGAAGVLAGLFHALADSLPAAVLIQQEPKLRSVHRRRRHRAPPILGWRGAPLQ